VPYRNAGQSRLKTRTQGTQIAAVSLILKPVKSRTNAGNAQPRRCVPRASAMPGTLPDNYSGSAGGHIFSDGPYNDLVGAGTR